MSKYSTAKGLVDATKGVQYYEVVAAEYANDAFPPKPFRVFAQCVPGAQWATDEEDAACLWAEERFSDYDDMVALVTHSDGRKWQITVTIDPVPSFNIRHVTEVKS